MIKWLKEHKKISYLIYILIIILIGVIFCLTYKKENITYSIEFEANSKFVLYFNDEDVIVNAKCLNDACKKDLDVDDFIKVNYNDLQRQINFTLYNELNNGSNLNIKLSSGKKDISNLLDIYKSEENNSSNDNQTDNQEEIKEEQDNSNVVENRPSNSQHNSNKVENEANNNKNNNIVENNNQNNSSNQNNSTPNNTQAITPLDIKIIWIPTSYSFYRVSFTNYSTTPMSYNQKDNGAIPYKNGDSVSGYMQIFNLKEQGITKDDACITFTQNKYYNDEAGATTIVPLYNNKTVSYRKFCLGLNEGVYYSTNYNEVAANVNNSSNVYEWINHKWTYVGTLENLEFTERNSQGYTQEFDVLTYIDLAYDRIINEQYPILVIKQRKELEALEQEEDEMEATMEEERQELIKICGYSHSQDITYECELQYAEFGNKWTYERGIIEEKRSEILGMDFNIMYDFSILDEK